tara:strand:+ start:142 stop:420 length:279 start_codon:yes stop_codon:yes gene_type:complete
MADEVKIKMSKKIEQLGKGDVVKVDGLVLEVDAHLVLMDHGNTKEMALELFDPKTEDEFQLRYFSDQPDTSLRFLKLNEIVYDPVEIGKVEF